MRQHTPILLLVGITAYVSAQSGRVAPGAGQITGVPAPGSTVDNPQIDLTLFRPFCLTDMDCESGNCVDGVNDSPDEVFPLINVQDIPNVFYCGNPLGPDDCQAIEQAARAPNDDVLEFQRIDGICNNLDPQRQLYGSREHLQLRRMNGVPFAVSAAESGAPDQVDSVRLISDQVIDQISSIPNQYGASTLLVYMGQFIDHDLTLIEFLPPSERIFLQGTPPLEDSFFFDLSVIVPGSDPVLNPNAATAWADLSMVYGSDIETARSLRDPSDFAKLDSLFRGGQEFLPRASEINEPGNDRFVETAMSPMIPGLFAAGDIRTNEQIMLASFHTLFMREHNRLVTDQIRSSASNVPQSTLNLCPPGTTVEQTLQNQQVADACELIYQLARRVNIAQWQKLVFVEYFDSWHNLDQEIGGPNSLPPFVYNDTLSPDIDIFFSTVTYRFGHTGVVNYVARLDPEEGSTMDSVFLGNAFFNPGAVVRDGGADTLLNGAANQCHERRDSFIVSGIRNFLFGAIPDAPDSDNMDLPSFNIERGRDHEVALYNDARAFYGLPTFDTFLEVVNAPGLPDQSCIAEMLEQTFGEIDNCDSFVCGLAEPSTRGELGELFFAAQDDQFRRIRDGDRFYYLNEEGPTPEQLQLAGVTVQEIDNFQMQNVLERNTFPGMQVFNPSPFQTDACCLSTGDVSNTPVCVRETGLEANFRRFELVNLPICDALEQLDLLNFVAGTMNPQSFRPYSCSCRPIQDSAQMVLFNVVAQAVEQTGGIGMLTTTLSSEMMEASSLETNERFPNMDLSTDSQGNAEVMVEILPTMDPENELTAEELVGVFERTNRLSQLGPNSLMAADNMDMVCINCPPLPNAQVDTGVGGVEAAAGGASLIGLPVAAGGAVLGAIGLVLLLAIGFGVRYRMKQNELPNFTSGQEAV